MNDDAALRYSELLGHFSEGHSNGVNGHGLPAALIQNSHRGSILKTVAGMLRKNIGATENEIMAFLQAFNEERCDPPCQYQELAQIVMSVMVYQPDDPQLVNGLSKLFGAIKKSRETQQGFAKQYQPVIGTELLAGNYMAPATVIEEMVHVGLTLLAGPPKAGKSFLAMQMAIAVSRGAALFGTQRIVRPGKVSYLSLEENRSQNYSKCEMLTPDNKVLDNIPFQYSCNKLLNGGKEFIEYIIELERPTLMVIDSYRALAEDSGKGDIVAKEYAQVDLLSKLAKEQGTAIVMICHTSKFIQGKSITDAIAGTYGNTAAADCLMLLRPDGDAFLLEGEGREIREYRFAVERRFDEGLGWEVKAKGEDVRFSAARESIFMLLLEEKERGPMLPKQIISSLGMKGDTVYSLLRRMVAAGQIHKTADGKYVPLGDALYTNVIPFRPKDTSR